MMKEAEFDSDRKTGEKRNEQEERRLYPAGRSRL